MRVRMNLDKKHAVIVTIGAFVASYYALGAWIIHCDIDRFLLPHVALAAKTSEDASFRIGTTNEEILVRRYGKAEKGCIIFFPGQHAGVPKYERYLYPKFKEAGLEVFSLSYPGQEGASGTTSIPELLILIGKVIARVEKSCSMRRTVFVGRSLGSMLAISSVSNAKPAGVVLEGAAPSLSQAAKVYLNNKWYLKPFSLLPIKSLLRHDYSLAEAFKKLGYVPVVIFQGTADTTTPLSLLQKEVSFPAGVRLRAIEGGTHSDTYRIAMDEYVETVVEMASGKLPSNKDRTSISSTGRR